MLACCGYLATISRMEPRKPHVCCRNRNIEEISRCLFPLAAMRVSLHNIERKYVTKHIQFTIITDNTTTNNTTNNTPNNSITFTVINTQTNIDTIMNTNTYTSTTPKTFILYLLLLFSRSS